MELTKYVTIEIGMKSLIKYLGLMVLSLIISELITLFFFYLRYLLDKNGFPAGWVLIIPLFTAFINGCIIYFVGKFIKVEKVKEFSIVIFILWLLFLYSSILFKR